MSDRDPFGQGPTEAVPPVPGAEPSTPPTPLPPIGGDRDPDPTRVMGTTPSPGDLPPTTAMPPTGAVPPAGGPYEPGPPYGAAAAGGGGAGGGEPPYDTPDEDPWYRQPGPLAALIAGIAALLVAVIALIVWASDDDSTDSTLPTIESTTTTVPGSTTTTTVPESTTTSSTTTSTSTTTTSTTTTSTTLPPTTTEAPTTTAAPTTTTEPATTTTLPATAWDYVTSDPDFSEFVAAVEAAGSEGLFQQPGLFTFLIPTNDAFPPPASPAVDWSDYVRSGALQAAQILAMPSIEMDSGVTLAVDAQPDPPTIGGAPIETEDVGTRNGFVQVLGGFVTPE